MEKLSKVTLFILSVAIVIFCIWIITRSRGQNLSASGSSSMTKNINNQEKSESSDYPCGAITSEKANQEIFGYPSEISLSDAIKNFNELQKCYPYAANFPPLTEDEVIASIVSGPDYGREGSMWLLQKDILQNIVIQKKVPKGALLVGEGGGCEHNSAIGKGEICAKGQRIYLFIGLDKSPRASESLKLEQIFLIRKTLFKVETSQNMK